MPVCFAYGLPAVSEREGTSRPAARAGPYHAKETGRYLAPVVRRPAGRGEYSIRFYPGNRGANINASGLIYLCADRPNHRDGDQPAWTQAIKVKSISTGCERAPTDTEP